jgi:hypothetical protein
MVLASLTTTSSLTFCNELPLFWNKLAFDVRPDTQAASWLMAFSLHQKGANDIALKQQYEYTF